MRIPIFGTPAREPDSGLKQFSKIKFNARPREARRDKIERGEKKGCEEHEREQGRWGPTTNGKDKECRKKMLNKSKRVSKGRKEHFYKLVATKNFYVYKYLLCKEWLCKIRYQWVCFLLCRAGSWLHQWRHLSWKMCWDATQSWDLHCTEPDLEMHWHVQNLYRLHCLNQDVPWCNHLFLKYRDPPILVLSMPMSKASTRFSKNIRTSRKLRRPMLQEPSTRITMSAMASVRHTNWSAAGTSEKKTEWHLNWTDQGLNKK